MLEIQALTSHFVAAGHCKPMTLVRSHWAFLVPMHRFVALIVVFDGSLADALVPSAPQIRDIHGEWPGVAL